MSFTDILKEYQEELGRLEAEWDRLDSMGVDRFLMQTRMETLRRRIGMLEPAVKAANESIKKKEDKAR